MFTPTLESEHTKEGGHSGAAQIFLSSTQLISNDCSITTLGWGWQLLWIEGKSFGWSWQLLWLSGRWVQRVDLQISSGVIISINRQKASVAKSISQSWCRFGHKSKQDEALLCKFGPFCRRLYEPWNGFSSSRKNRRLLPYKSLHLWRIYPLTVVLPFFRWYSVALPTATHNLDCFHDWEEAHIE